MSLRVLSSFFALLGLLFCMNTYAAALVTPCAPHSFLENGFSVATYNKCSTMLRACPPVTPGSPMLDDTCIKKVMKNNLACNQLNQLAENLNMSPSMLNVKQVDDSALVELLFPADGQHQYFIINSKGCLVDTVVDPRKLDETLRTKFAANNFIILNQSEPEYKETADTQTFIVPLRIADGCIACANIGDAKVRIDFINQGKQVKISLEEFKPASPVAQQ